MAEFHRLKSRKDQEPEEWTALNRTAELLTKRAATADMPSLDHLTRADYQQVYEPAEDTFLLIDALKYEFEQGVFEPALSVNDDFVLLEIGCGTGVPTVWFRQEWQRRYPGKMLRTYITDINPHALQVALRTDESNNQGSSLTPIQAVLCDLATGLLDSLAGSVDVLIFNPPYVPTPDEEVVVVNFSNDQKDVANDTIIAAAWAGGTLGRRVVDRALPQLQRLLRGKAYLVTVDDNQPAVLAELCRNKHSLSVQPLLRRRSRNEYLTIQKIAPH